MILDHVELNASPYFHRASCPKDGSDMVELPNGWFEVCWYCKKCEYPYKLKMVKMANVNKENLEQILKEKGLTPKTKE